MESYLAGVELLVRPLKLDQSDDYADEADEEFLEGSKLLEVIEDIVKRNVLQLESKMIKEKMSALPTLTFEHT